MKSSITTRLLYFTFLLAVLIVTSIMLSPTVANGLQEAVSYIRVYLSTESTIRLTDNLVCV